MNKEYLITGGSGTLGKTMLKYLLKNKKVKGIRVYSRGEILQEKIRKDLKQEFGKDIPVSFLIGDVRDKDRLKMALKGVDICIHAAAMKIVPTAENDPIECIKTNIIGSSNVIEAAIECGVKKVMGISTDKACSPENLYGATKMCMEKLFLNSRVYSADKKN
jgi:UDP-N-acetylglucosamine 4,6-dehydratase